MIACVDKFQAQSRAFDMSNRDRDLFFYVCVDAMNKYFVTSVGILHQGQYVLESYYQTSVTELGL